MTPISQLFSVLAVVLAVIGGTFGTPLAFVAIALAFAYELAVIWATADELANS